MNAMYLVLAVTLIAVGIAIWMKHRTTNRREPYQCLTAHMEWDGSTPADDRIKRILSERAARLEGQKPTAICDEAEKFYPTEIFCGNRFHRDR